MDFLNVILENSFVPLYGIAALLSLYRYRKYFNTPLKYLPILFAYTFFNELLGIIILKNEHFSLFAGKQYSYYNMVIYNIYSIIFYLYFFYVFRFYIENRKIKKIIGYGSILFLGVAFINPFFYDFIKEAQTYTYVFGGLMLICCSFSYFVQLRDPARVFSINKDLLFWLSLGLFTFYMGYLPIKVHRYFNAINGLSEYIHLRKIHLTLIIIMYSCFIIGFIRMRRRLTT